MPRQSAATLLTALGFPAEVDHLYTRVLAHSGRELAVVAQTMLTSPAGLLEVLEPLLERGIARVDGDVLLVDTPPAVVSRMLAERAAAAGRAQADLVDLAAAIPYLTAPAAGPSLDEVADVRPLDGEVTTGGAPVHLLAELIDHCQGDLLWLRPDRFERPREEAMAAMVGRAVARGRRSRAVYPVAALTEARETLQLRARVGEEVRVLPVLPSRLLVVGTTHAVLPEPLGFYDEPRSLIRQRGIVEALTLWFELLWERAEPVPSLEARDPRPDLRRFLLEQLAAGAQDEQIARRLGLSLRTVRRRVAELMAELGADSRFQAGAEAVRRGWL